MNEIWSAYDAECLRIYRNRTEEDFLFYYVNQHSRSIFSLFHHENKSLRFVPANLYPYNMENMKQASENEKLIQKLLFVFPFHCWDKAEGSLGD